MNGNEMAGTGQWVQLERGKIFINLFIHPFNKHPPTPPVYMHTMFGSIEAERGDGCSQVKEIDM